MARALAALAARRDAPLRSLTACHIGPRPFPVIDPSRGVRRARVEQVRPVPGPEGVGLAMVLFATRPNLLLLALGTTFACRFLCLLVPPRYLLLELGERCVRCRSSGSGLVSLLRHLTCTPRRSLQ